MAISSTRARVSIVPALTLTNKTLLMTLIKTYRSAKRAAWSLTLRLRFLDVSTIIVGAIRITTIETSWSGEKVSPRNVQPKIKYSIGAS